MLPTVPATFIFSRRQHEAIKAAGDSRKFSESEYLTSEPFCNGIDTLVATPNCSRSERASLWRSNYTLRNSEPLSLSSMVEAQTAAHNSSQAYTISNWDIKSAIEFKNSLASSTKGWNREPWRQ